MAQSDLKASEKDADMYHLSMSEEAMPLLAAVKKFCAEEVAPITDAVLQTRRRSQGPLELGAGSARIARQGERQGEEAGAVEFLPARRRNRRRSEEPRLRLHRGRARSSAAGVGVPELQRAGHRQHGSTRTRRHAGAEGKVAEAAAERRDPLVFRHDRAAPGVERRAEHRHARRTRSATSGSSTARSTTSPAPAIRAARS